MAIIKCPECGNQVSDKASSCIHCGFPLAQSINNGVVKIKLSPVLAPTGFNGNQKVSITSDEITLWEGKSGEVAEIKLNKVTNITVKYHLSMMHYGGECSGVIDPSQNTKYNVSARQGFMSTKLSFHQVDVIDAD